MDILRVAVRTDDADGIWILIRRNDVRGLAHVVRNVSGFHRFHCPYACLCYGILAVPKMVCTTITILWIDRQLEMLNVIQQHTEKKEKAHSLNKLCAFVPHSGLEPESPNRHLTGFLRLCLT